MKLKSIELNNFKCFYGSQIIDFSLDTESNVTVIHGENGHGKTTLLNAFKWVFYGKTDFEGGDDNNISERLADECNVGDESEVSVSIKFSHDNRIYEAIRSETYSKKGDRKCKRVGKSDFKLIYKDESGAYNESGNPNTHINQILPERLHPYFFLNGERIEKLSRIEGSDDIHDAIKAVMGIALYERAVRHLRDNVIRQLRKEYRDLTKGNLQETLRKEQEFEDKIKKLEKEESVYEENINGYKKSQEEVQARIREIKPVEDSQKAKEKLEEERETLRENKKTIKKEKIDLISKVGFLAFAKDIIAESDKILEDRRQRGELPSKIKSQFLDDLLQQGSCICQRPLEPNSKHYLALEKLKETAVTSDVENAFITLKGALIHMKKSRNTLQGDINEKNQLWKDTEDEINRLTGEIDVISESLINSKIEDVSNLQRQNLQLSEKIEKQLEKKGGVRQRIIDDTSLLNDIQKERKRLEKEDQEQAQASRYLESAVEIHAVLDNICNEYIEKVREKLSTKVNQTFTNIMRKDYWVEIDKNFSLKIKKKIGENTYDVLDKSTGELQVTSLSFIGGLVSLAKEWHQNKNMRRVRGGIYPIIMDSPYGSLDPEYQSKVAKMIPELADQIILMVSNSQWKGQVEPKIAFKKGKEYTLMYHAPKQKKADTITSSYIVSEKYEFVEIKEGYYE